MVKPNNDFARLSARDTVFVGAAHLTWLNPEGNAMCRIYFRKETNFLNQSLWPDQCQWLKEKTEAMHKVFSPIVKNL